MELALEWSGPYTFAQHTGEPILSAPVAQGPGVYLWLVATDRGLLPHYVGEAGRSIARRHYEHFREYASGTYSVRDSTEFAAGRERFLFAGPLWRKDGWRKTQQFIDEFTEYARQLAATLEMTQIFVAPLDAEQRLRRRIESAIIRAIYDLPETSRGLFPPGYRTWARRSDERPLTIVNRGPLPLPLPDRLEV